VRHPIGVTVKLLKLLGRPESKSVVARSEWILISVPRQLRHASLLPQIHTQLPCRAGLKRREHSSNRVVSASAKLDASCRVRVPAEQGLTIRSYRVLQLSRRFEPEPNEIVEAYTGNHVGRKGDRNPQADTAR